MIQCTKRELINEAVQYAKIQTKNYDYDQYSHPQISSISIIYTVPYQLSTSAIIKNMAPQNVSWKTTLSLYQASHVCRGMVIHRKSSRASQWPIPNSCFNMVVHIDNIWEQPPRPGKSRTLSNHVHHPSWSFISLLRGWSSCYSLPTHANSRPAHEQPQGEVCASTTQSWASRLYVLITSIRCIMCRWQIYQFQYTSMNREI